MKRRNKTNYLRLIPVLFLGLSGCFFSTRTEEMRTPNEPYGVVYVSRTTDLVHSATRVELYHWDKRGEKVLVWRFISGQLVWTNDMALFLGFITVGLSDKNAPTTGDKERLFAVEGSGPPVDITDDVIRLWVRDNAINLSDALQRAYVPSVKRQVDHFAIKVKLPMGSSGVVELSKDRILDMIRLAKEKGKPMKDPGFGTPYLKRDWEREVDKK